MAVSCRPRGGRMASSPPSPSPSSSRSEITLRLHKG
ncbi:MAG: hypothetical protein ACOH2H_08855 [Cypionkella sp.]